MAILNISNQSSRAEDEHNSYSHWRYEGLCDAYSRSPGVKPPLGTKLIGWGYQNMVKKFIFNMSADEAHDFTIDKCWQLGKFRLFMNLLHSVTDNSDTRLERRIYDLHYPNPFGLSAGLDKDAKLLTILDAAGFGFCSYGSMTNQPCEGNPKPWFARSPEHESLIIHAGLPNSGADEVLARADKTYTDHGAIKHASIGFTNRAYPGGLGEIIEDFASGVQKVMDSNTDVCEVNVSCPNLTEGKPFSNPRNLDLLFQRLDGIVGKNGYRKPVQVKLFSMTPQQLDPLLAVLAEHDVQGVATCNLFEDRSKYPDITELPAGSLSGRPCNENAIKAVEFTRSHYGNRFVIEGIGGVFDEMDALRMLDSGADLVGFITTLMFNGPQQASVFKAALQAAYSQLEKEGWEGMGVDYEQWRRLLLSKKDKHMAANSSVLDY